MTEQGPSEWLESIAEIFEALAVDWTLIGALAANRFRAEPRFTTDVDMLAEWHPALADALEDAGYDVTISASDGDPPHLVRCHRGPENVDILLPVVDYQRVALSRAVDHRLTVEDVLIHKLIAWRRRDQDDIRSILTTGVVLDTDYLQHWIDEWDVADRWLEAADF